eukprot:scaffold390002_cov34-Prasinocladus_malaysianus.AAC.1
MLLFIRWLQYWRQSEYLRHVKVHLVAVKVGVVWVADALVEAEGAPGHNAGLVSHDGHAMQAGLAVEQHDVAILQVALHNVPNLAHGELVDLGPG